MEKNIQELVNEELERAQGKFKPFGSAHEGWAIIQEEIEELQEEIDKMKEKQKALWVSVKGNEKEKQLNEADELYQNTLALIIEAIQVAAMARRFSKDIGK